VATVLRFGARDEVLTAAPACPVFHPATYAQTRDVRLLRSPNFLNVFFGQTIRLATWAVSVHGQAARGPRERMRAKRPHPQVGEPIKLGPLRSACERRRWLLSPTSLGRYRLVALTRSWDLFDHAKDLFVEAKPPGCSRKSGKDDYNKFSLPTRSGFCENFLKGGARRLITDAKFDRSGSKCFSPDEVKCQPGLSERQAKMRPQQINGLVHNKVRDSLRRHVASVPLLSRGPLSRDLLLCAKHLFVATRTVVHGLCASHASLASFARLLEDAAAVA